VTGTAALASLAIIRAKSGSEIHLVFGAAAATLVNVSAGEVYFDADCFGVSTSGITTLNIGAQPTGQAPTVYVAGAVATLNLYGGTVEWLKGTLTAVNQFGGTFRCGKSVSARTCTTFIKYGGETDFRTGKPGVLTFTNAVQYKGGIMPVFDIGESLQRS
jgi:hypothetical protein